MKNFKFNLDSVLLWKKRQQEEALKLMGEATQRKQRGRDELEMARRYLGELLSSLHQQREEGHLYGWAQTMFMRTITHQEGVCRHKQEILEKLKKEEDMARENYLVKHREAEAIEKLRQKRRKNFEKEENLRSEKELEEIVLSRSMRDDYAAN